MLSPTMGKREVIPILVQFAKEFDFIQLAPKVAGRCLSRGGVIKVPLKKNCYYENCTLIPEETE